MRVSEVEYKDRIEYVRALLGQHRPTGQIVALMGEKYGIKPRTVKAYIGRAHKNWKRVSSEKQTYYRNKYLDRMENLYQQCYDRGRYTNCVQVQDIINKMLGLYDHSDRSADETINITYQIIGEKEEH